MSITIQPGVCGGLQKKREKRKENNIPIGDMKTEHSFYSCASSTQSKSLFWQQIKMKRKNCLALQSVSAMGVEVLRCFTFKLNESIG